MKTTIFILATILLGIGNQIRAEIRDDIGKDIPLHDAIRRANEEMDFVPKLTVDEVIAAVRAIKIKHPDIEESTYKVYRRIVDEKVLPRGMYFDQIRQWGDDSQVFHVDWKDLIYRDEKTGLGFSYRLRWRFVSFQTRNSCSPNRPNKSE